MQHKQEKHFHPSLLFALLSWSVIIYFIFFVDPIVIRDFPFREMYFPFFLFLAFALFLSFRLLLAHTRRGLFLTIGIILFLYLRVHGLGHLLNLLLLSAFLLTLELAFSSRHY